MNELDDPNYQEIETLQQIITDLGLQLAERDSKIAAKNELLRSSLKPLGNVDGIGAAALRYMIRESLETDSKQESSDV